MRFGFEPEETLRQQAGSYSAAPPVGASLLAIACIIAAFPSSDYKDITMEAEQLNALSNSLQDLRSRSNELRRFL
jgi:hypothetical protein